MSVLSDLVAALATGAVEVVDLTAPLSARPRRSSSCPPEFGQTAPFALEEISRVRRPRARPGTGTTSPPASTPAPTSTRPSTGSPGRDGDDVASVPAGRLVAPAAVLDVADRRRADPDFLLEVGHIEAWEAEHGPLPDGGWLLVRTGWDARSHSQQDFLNADDDGPHTPGISASAPAGWPRSRR